MATFISLINYTQQGIEKIKEAPKRLDAAKQAFQSMGVELKGFYLTMGRYDIVTISEAPEAETMQKALLVLSMGGNVRSETLTASPEEEFRKIISGLP